MVSTDPQQIAAVLSGDVQAGNNPWSTRASCVGAVAIVQSTSGDVMTAFEAMKRGVGGEVLCAVK